jgi:hypothetical protein
METLRLDRKMYQVAPGGKVVCRGARWETLTSRLTVRQRCAWSPIHTSPTTRLRTTAESQRYTHPLSYSTLLSYFTLHLPFVDITTRNRTTFSHHPDTPPLLPSINQAAAPHPPSRPYTRHTRPWQSAHRQYQAGRRSRRCHADAQVWDGGG